MIITSQKAKKAILTALGDEEMVKIMDSVLDTAKSVNQIMRDQKIPYTTAYRKTKWLLDEGLLVVSKIDITPDGKKSSLVYAVLKSITVRYEQRNITVEAEQNFDIVRKVMQKFFSME
jgi:DNA-binding transcriptional ArsR family regulator